MHRLLPIVVVLAFVGCGHAPPNTTPQAAVAHYGTDVVTGVTGVQHVIIAATEATPPVLTVDRATPVMNDLRLGLDRAHELSIALRAYDAATTNDAKASLAIRIEALLGGITQALSSSTASGLPPDIVQQTSALVGNVTTTIATIRAAIALKGGTR